MTSPEDPMQEPAGRLPGRKKPGAIEPKTATLFVLHPIIVADGDPAPALAPPFATDALRPVGACHAMGKVPPAEGEWRIVGHRRNRLDEFRWLEQADRPDPSRIPGGGFGRGEDRCRNRGPFWQMALL